MEKTVKEESFFKSAFVFCARVFRFMFLLAVVLSVLLYFVVHTDMFQSWAKQQLLQFANDNLRGKIDFGSLDIDIYKGLSLNDLHVFADGDTVVSCKSLSIHYSIESLYFKTISLQSLILKEPRVKVLRSNQDSIWNVEKIAKPSTDTAKSEPFDWFVAVRDLQIQDGMFALVDSIYKGNQQKGNVDYIHMVYDQLQFRSAFYGRPTQREFTLALHTISLVERNTQFKLTSLSGVCKFDSTGVETYGLEVVTPTTEFTLIAKWKNINFFALTNEMLFTAPFEAVIDAPKASAHDARFFIPPVFIVGGDVTNLRGKASGSLRNMDVDYLEMATKQSNVRVKGNLRNLDIIDKFTYDVTMDNSYGNYDEVRSYLPTVPLPDLPFVGTTTIRSARATGSIRHADANFDGVASCGGFKGELGSNFDPKKTLSYYIKGTLTQFDLHKTLPTIEQMQNTVLTGEVDVKGSGVSLDKMELSLFADLSASTISGIALDGCDIRLHAEKGSQFFLDTFAVRFKQFSDGSIENPIVKSELEKGSTLYANGKILMRDSKNPEYFLNLKATSLPLARLTKSALLPEYISTEFRVNGSGFHPDSIQARVTGAKIPFCYVNNTLINPFEIQRFILSKIDGERKLDFRSDYLSVLVTGNYRFEPLAAILQQQVADIMHFFESKSNFVIDGKERTEYDTLQVKSSLITEPTKCFITVEIKPNIVPILTTYTKAPIEEIQGKLYLEVESVNNVNTVKILPSTFLEKATIVSEDDVFFLDKIKFSSTIQTTPLNRYEPITIVKASMSSDSSIVLGSTEFSHPKVTFSYDNNKATYKASTSITSIGAFDIVGSIVTLPQSYEFYIDSLDFDYQGKAYWELIKPFQIHLQDKIFTIDSASIQRNKAETIRIAGSVDLEKFYNMTVDISSFPLSQVPLFTNDESLNEIIKSLKGNVNRLLLTLNKEFKNPAVEVVGSCSNLEFNSVKLGNAIIDMAYAENSMTGIIDIIPSLLRKDQKLVEITVDTLPISLNFSEGSAFLMEDKPISMNAKVSKLPLAIASPFIPSVRNLTGVANLNLDIRGDNYHDLQYTGLAKGHNVRFISVSNNMEYLAEASARIKNNKVYLDTAIVRNNPLDLLNGRADITGDITIKDLAIDSFNFDITTKQIAILSDDSRSTALGMYGPFVVGSTKEPIKFYGTFEKPFLTGPVIVRYGNIVVVPKVKNLNAVTEFEYIVLDSLFRFQDSVPIYKDTTVDKRKFKPITTQNSNTKQENQKVEKPKIEGAQKAFAELLSMDLNVEIVGAFTVTMDLTTPGMLIPTTLVAKIAPCNLNYKQENNIPQLWGTMKLAQGSTYSFYRPFKAEGILEFNGDMYNPALKLVTTSSSSRYYNERNQNIDIKLDITGTQEFPEIKFSYKIDDVDGPGDDDRIKGDAIMLILMGRTQRELGSQTASAGTDIASSSFAAILSKIASDFLQGSNVIQSFDLQFQNGNTNINNAQVQVGGNLISDVNWRFSGTLADLSTNSLITIEFPLAALIDKEYFQNVVFQFIRSANTVTSVNRLQKEWELKLFIRKIF